MANNKQRAIITARIESALKDRLKREAETRGHTPSRAAEHALMLGLPLYLKRFPARFRRIKDAA